MTLATAATTEAIRDHYDRLSLLYGAFWGEHIHHGFWDGGAATPAAAQVRLVEKLAETAGVTAGSHVLDVGCGLGGSAIWLAARLNCTVLGITISPVQVTEATRKARRAGVSDRVRFRVMDASVMNFAPASFDAVWVIEASEHLHDKAHFVRECAACLRPGGVFAMCAWLDRSRARTQDALVEAICDAMLCPSLARVDDYMAWLDAAGFDDLTAQDVTSNVAPTWAHARAILRHPAAQIAIRIVDRRIRRFVAAFDLMHNAMRDGVIGYGMITGRKNRLPAGHRMAARVARGGGGSGFSTEAAPDRSKR